MKCKVGGEGGGRARAEYGFSRGTKVGGYLKQNSKKKENIERSPPPMTSRERRVLCDNYISVSSKEK